MAKGLKPAKQRHATRMAIARENEHLILAKKHGFSSVEAWRKAIDRGVRTPLLKLSARKDV